MKTRFYYRLDELYEHDLTEDNEYPYMDNLGFEWLLNKLIGRSDLIEDTTINMELFKHVWLLLSKGWVTYIDVEHSRWEFPERPDPIGSDAAKELAHDIVSVYEGTKDYYIPLISMYQTEMENILNPIQTVTSSTSESRFNDTPQNAQTTPGQYDADNYSTNVTKGKGDQTVSYDGGTLMSRLKEIQDDLKNLYDDWAEEFNKIRLGD